MRNSAEVSCCCVISNFSCVGRGSLPYLDTIEDEHVDLVLISHFHLDHCGALPVLPSRIVIAR